jgi:hypothetical protein
MRHPHRWLVILLVALLAMSASPSAEAAQPLVPTGVSGYEAFPGIHKALGSVTSGASFGGWTNAPSADAWVPRSHSTGGSWGVTVTYSGTPGLGRSVTILPGGYWFLQGGGAALAGQVQSGRYPPQHGLPAGGVGQRDDQPLAALSSPDTASAVTMSLSAWSTRERPLAGPQTVDTSRCLDAYWYHNQYRARAAESNPP